MIIRPKITSHYLTGPTALLNRAGSLELPWETLLSRKFKQKDILALGCIAYNMRIAALFNCGIAIPRNRDGTIYRDRPDQKYKFSLGQRAIVRATDLLSESGYIECHYKASYANIRLASIYRPTEKFTSLLLDPATIINNRVIKGNVVIRDISLNELLLSSKYNNIRDNLLIINNNIYNNIKDLPPYINNYNNNIYNDNSSSLPITSPMGAVYPTNFISIEDFKLNRVFKNDLNRGGRFYGNYQLLRGQDRLKLIIGGSPVVELDYTALHPTMLYNSILQSTEDIDMYDIGIGGMRSLIKKAFMITFNTPDELSAVRAVAYRISRGAYLHTTKMAPFEFAKELIERIKAKHAPLAPFFFKNNSMHLQNLDSQIAERIMLRFASMNKLCLGVHDSFIVKAEDEQLLREVMAECYREVMGTTDCPKIEKKEIKGEGLGKV